MKRAYRVAPLALALLLGLSACDDNNNNNSGSSSGGSSSSSSSSSGSSGSSSSSSGGTLSQVQHVVVIYAENHSFDSVFGKMPGVNGLSAVLDSTGKPTAAYVKQVDRDGTTVLATLPPAFGGVTSPGYTPAVTQADSTGKPNAPYSFESTYGLTASTVTNDLVHRFFDEQMQINGGKMDSFAAWSDVGGLSLGNFDYSGSKLATLAKQYVIADNWFNGAFGGSFLNHQYLICACAPKYTDAESRGASRISAVDKDAGGNYTTHLTTASTSPASALSGKPVFVNDGAISPKDYFGAGDGYRGINTLQPAYQPSGNTPKSGATGNDLLFADPTASSTLEPQTQTTIGDLLTAKNVSWRWYSGAWNLAVSDGPKASGDRQYIYKPSTPQASPDFQAHHQPFNYYAEFDPVTHADARNAHLRDESDLIADALAGTLPAVAFFKPQGNHNQHPGYANLADGDDHIADLIAKLQATPEWNSMVIIVTYDEFGGAWDHVAPPKGDKLGPGTRLPTMIISPLVKPAFIDHTQYDSGSINRFIIKRFGLDASGLPGLAARDAALVANGGTKMGDMTNMLK